MGRFKLCTSGEEKVDWDATGLRKGRQVFEPPLAAFLKALLFCEAFWVMFHFASKKPGTIHSDYKALLNSCLRASSSPPQACLPGPGSCTSLQDLFAAGYLAAPASCCCILTLRGTGG